MARRLKKLKGFKKLSATSLKKKLQAETKNDLVNLILTLEGLKKRGPGRPKKRGPGRPRKVGRPRKRGSSRPRKTRGTGRGSYARVGKRRADGTLMKRGRGGKKRGPGRPRKRGPGRPRKVGRPAKRRGPGRPRKVGRPKGSKSKATRRSTTSIVAHPASPARIVSAGQLTLPFMSSIGTPKSGFQSTKRSRHWMA